MENICIKHIAGKITEFSRSQCENPASNRFYRKFPLEFGNLVNFSENPQKMNQEIFFNFFLLEMHSVCNSGRFDMSRSQNDSCD